MMPTWPLWQKVSLLSSPVWMLVTQMSRLLMKLMKSGSTGQILASMRVPEHWLLISTGCTGKVCKSARDNEERHFLLEEICCNTLETDGSRRKWLLIWKSENKMFTGTLENYSTYFSLCLLYQPKHSLWHCVNFDGNCNTGVHILQVANKTAYFSGHVC